MNFDYLKKLIEPYRPLKDINIVIVETNRIFHKFEAKDYDGQHPEIFDQLPPIYKDMCGLLPSDKKLKVLDFGCGTGFEAAQLLDNLENIELIYCYDISKEMLGICKRKLSDRSGGIFFINDIIEIPADMKFDILVTNSLLHHLPQPIETIEGLKKYLSDNCVYIMGHESSVRFYKNRSILKLNKLAMKKSFIRRVIKKAINIKRYPYYFRRIFNRGNDENGIYIANRIDIDNSDINSPYKSTAVDTVKAGLFEIVPTVNIINRLVDCYVPHDAVAAKEGHGFDFKNMELHGEWDLIYSKTYNFLKENVPFYKLSVEKKRKYELLEKEYPDDGLNFCCVWKRKKTSISQCDGQ